MTGWGHVALHRRAGDGPMAPVGVYVPGRPGDPMRIVNTDNPGLTPARPRPDPPEPHRRRHPAVETPSQVCADRQQPETIRIRGSQRRSRPSRPADRAAAAIASAGLTQTIRSRQPVTLSAGRIMLTPARPFDPGDQDGTPAAAVKRLFPMRPGHNKTRFPGVLALLSPSPPEARTWSSSTRPKQSCATPSA